MILLELLEKLLDQSVVFFPAKVPSNIAMSLILVLVLLLGLFTPVVDGKSSSVPCTWDSKTGSHYDMRPLILNSKSKAAYSIKDGDIPCTPEEEPSYNYVWNFCDNVPSSLMPSVCNDMGKKGVVLQWAVYEDPGDFYCYIIGHYDKDLHELSYKLLDSSNPAKGVSISYPKGEKCSDKYPNSVRSATVDVECANVESVVVSAQEPSVCQYHIDMKSYYGCPTECPVTSKGLCSSHGHCAYDPKKKVPYCYCNEGYSGSDCSQKSSSSSKDSSDDEYDGFSVQLGLLITLLIIALGLTGGVVYLAWQIGEYRKEQISNNYNTLPGSEAEMVDTVNFS